MVLLARSERLSTNILEDTKSMPLLELVTPINKDRVHNYVIHPSHLSEAITDNCKCEGAKGIQEFEHIMDNTSVILDTPDLILEGMKKLIQGQEKNNLSNLRATVMLNTTENAETLSRNIRDSIWLLNTHCQE